MDMGRENAGNKEEDFCMTVLGLRIARRANAVSALHGEVSRAMWKGLNPGKTEDRVPIGHITNGVHARSRRGSRRRNVASLRSPSWVPAGSSFTAPRRCIWEGIENVDDGELWGDASQLEITVARIRAKPRAMKQAELRGRRRAETRIRLRWRFESQKMR